MSDKIVARYCRLPKQLDRRKLDRLIEAGHKLSNIAYNLNERPRRTLSEDDLLNLNACRREWDSAVVDFLKPPRTKATR